MNKVKNTKQTKQNKESKSTIIAITILILIMLISFFQIAKNNINGNNPNYNIVLDPINTTISSKDGKAHSIYIELAISGQKKYIDKLNKKAINVIILEELKKLDFEEITGIDGNKNLKEKILKSLKENYESIDKVYIRRFSTDIKIQQNIENDKNIREDYLKGFKWNKHD